MSGRAVCVYVCWMIRNWSPAYREEDVVIEMETHDDGDDDDANNQQKCINRKCK